MNKQDKMKTDSQTENKQMVARQKEGGGMGKTGEGQNGFPLISRIDKCIEMVKRLSTMRETRVQSLGWEDPLEKEMAIHSSTIAWKIPWTEEPGRL